MSWGSFVNDITGASQSARQQYKYNLKLQQQNQAWQTEQTNTAHQREVADLQNAGLNPVLSAGAGANAGSPGGGGVGGGVPQNPLEILGSAIGMYNNVQQTKNNTAKTNADIENETNKTNADVIKALADAGVSQKTIDYYIKHGVFPGATTTTSQSTPWGSSSETVPVGIKNTSTGETSAKKATERQQNKKIEKIQTERRIKEIHDKFGNWWY